MIAAFIFSVVTNNRVITERALGRIKKSQETVLLKRESILKVREKKKEMERESERERKGETLLLKLRSLRWYG